MTDVDIRAGLEYPRRGDDVLSVHALGGVLPALLNVLLVPLWLVAIVFEPAAVLLVAVALVQLTVGVFWAGYLVRVARTTVEGGGELPSLGDLTGLARDGLIGVLVGAVYIVPGVVLTSLLYVGIVGALVGAESVWVSDPRTAAAVGVAAVAAITVVSLVVFLYFVVAAYLLPASLVVVAATDDLGAAFAPGRLKPVVTSGEYALPWLVTVGGSFALYQVINLLTLVLVGYLLLPFLPVVQFYVLVAGFHMFGLAAVRTTESGTLPCRAASGGSGGPADGEQ